MTLEMISAQVVVHNQQSFTRLHLHFFFLNFVVDAKAMQWDFSLHDYAKLSKLNDVLAC